MTFMNHEQDVRAQGAYYSAGLRSYLVKVYNYMAMALGLTGLVAFLAASSETLMQAIYGSPLQWVVMLAPIGLVFFMSYKLSSLTMQATLGVFAAFSAMMGLSLSYIFLVYTSESIARVFFISASMFGAMAYYGNVTKKDLSQFGSFLMMGLVGIIIASIVNIFLGSAPLHFAISIVGVILFTGMTAFDAQKVKDMYFKFNDGSDVATKKLAIMGATTLYFDFINLFLSLLRLMGDSRR